MSGMRAPQIIHVRGRDRRVAAWIQALAPGQRLLALEGPRGVDPRRHGLPCEASDWYVDADGQPEPASFGLCLAHLEGVLLAQQPGAWLVGDGQGAALVLALACVWPRRLSGVIAIDGALAELPAGALAEAPLTDLPVWLAGSARESAPGLRSRGARVRCADSFDALVRRLPPWPGAPGLDRGTGAPVRGGGGWIPRVPS